MAELNERMKDPAIAAGVFLAGMDVSHENKEDDQFSVALDNTRLAILRLKNERDCFQALLASDRCDCGPAHERDHKVHADGCRYRNLVEKVRT